MPECKIVYPDKPVWEPLINVVGEKCGEFMFMGMVPVGEIWIYLYKHIVTRRYLNLDGRGGAYRFENGKYNPVEVEQALEYIDGLSSDGVMQLMPKTAASLKRLENSVQRFKSAVSRFKNIMEDIT